MSARINEEQLGAGFWPPRHPHLISLAKRACFTSDSAYRAMLERIAEELGPKSPAAELLALFESHRARAREALA